MTVMYVQLRHGTARNLSKNFTEKKGLKLICVPCVSEVEVQFVHLQPFRTRNFGDKKRIAGFQSCI